MISTARRFVLNVPVLRFVVAPAIAGLGLLALGSTASAQVVLQNFETGLKFDQCWSGENVGLSTSGVPLEGQTRLQTGPLNKNRDAYYLSPFITMRAGGFVRFKHRNESTGSFAAPVLHVELVATTGDVAATLLVYPHTTSTQPIVSQPQVPADGVYRVRWRFSGDSGNERVGLDELNIDGTLATTGPPQCGPITPSVTPPVARPDAATSLSGAAVVVQILDNDVAGTYYINRGSVDLRPEIEGISDSRDVRDTAGALIGRAAVDPNGLLTVTPVAGFVGAITVPYSVRDTQGHVSNTTEVVVTVRGTTLDLQVQATGPPAALAGASVTYTAIVSNLGPGAAAQATFTFVANAALGGLAASCPTTRTLSCGTPVVSGNTVTIPMTAIPAGTSMTLQLTGTILGGQGPTATVTSQVAAVPPDVDTNPGNNSTVVNTQIQSPPPGADLVIAISGTGTVVPGQTVTYTTVIRNDGPGASTAAVVTQSASGGLIFESNEGACPSAFPCDLGVIPAGQTRTITTRYRTTVPALIVPLPPAVIAATVAASNDPITDNNTASTQTQFNTALDVSVSITPDPATVPVGQPSEIFVIAANAGPNPARSFTVQLTLPPELTVTSATPQIGTISATGLWSIPEVGAGAQAELRLLVAPTAIGAFLMRAVATPPPTDTSADNDADDAVIHATAAADLATRLATTTPLPPVGTQATLTVYAGNLGPTAAGDARLVLTIPAGMSLVSATPERGLYNAAAGVWTIGSLAPGQVVTMAVVLSVNSPGGIAIARAVISDQDGAADPDLSNNSHALPFGVVGSADLSVTLASDIPAPVVGQLVAIRAVVYNGGPTPADATVTFTGPAGALTVVSATVSAGSTSGLEWQVGSLAVDGRATLDAIVRVELEGAIPIQAVVSSPVFDPDTTNNTALLTLSGTTGVGQVAIDFEDLTGSESCWAWPGMAPGGFTANGAPFGRTQANPPLQLLVHLVSSQLSGGTNRVVSPWIQMIGAGAIRFTTKITNVTSTPGLRVYLEDVATRTPILVLDRTYTAPPAPNQGAYESIPIPVSGIYRIRWEFVGSGGNSRGAIDDIVIDGRQVSAVGQPGQPVPPNSCNPDLPGNTPPVAVADFATTPIGTPVAVPILANDFDPDGTLNPAFVDLDPTGTLGETTTRDILRPDGVRMGQAVYDASGPSLTFTPEPGIEGTAIIPYTVQDDAGGVSNIALVGILVGSVTADLEVTISAPPTANANQPVAYVVRVGNRGPDGALQVSLGHVFTGTQVESATCVVEVGPAECGVGAIAGSTFNVTIPAIASGAAVSFRVVAIAPPFAGTISGQAGISVPAPVTDPNPANDTAVGQTIIGGPPPPPRADVAVSKTGPVEAAVGQTVRYTVTVANNGPDEAEGVAVTDPTPPGFTLRAVSGACRSINCWLGTLPAGQTRTIAYDYVAGFSTPGVSSEAVANSVTVSSTTPDPLLANNVASTVTRVFVQSELSLTASQNPESVIGQLTLLSFVAANEGPSAATDVAASIAMAPGLALEFSHGTRGHFDPATGLWTIGPLGSGEVAELRLLARVQATGPLTSSGELTEGLESDVDPSNNSASVTTTAVPSADVGLTSSTDNLSPLAGQTVTLTLNAANHGPSVASASGITGVLPVGLTYLSHTVTQGTLDTATGLWLPGPLGVGAVATLTVAVRVERNGVFNTSASITAESEFDPVQANNSTAVLLNAGPAADVGLEIRITPTVAEITQPVTVEFVVTNIGPSDTTDVVVSPTMPAGLRVTGFTVSAGTTVAGRWNIPSLAVGASATLTATAVVEQAAELAVTGRVTHALPDPNPVNDFALATLNGVGSTDVRITMVAATPYPLISDNTTVYVIVTNAGRQTSVPVEVSVTAAPLLAPIRGLTSQGDFTTASGRWSVGSIPPGSSEALAFVLQVTDSGSLPVSARIMLPPLRPSPTRPTVASVTLDVADPFRTVAELQLAMTGTPRIDAGGTTTVTATTINAGSTYAVDLTMSVAVPPGAQLATAVPSFGGVCTAPPIGGAGRVECVWPGQSVVGQARLRQITLTATADPGLPEGTRLDFAGQVRSSTTDPYLPNNVGSAVTVIAPESATADVSIAKAFADGSTVTSVPAGQPVAYRVTVTGNGPNPASGILVRETIPPGFSVVSATPSQGAIDDASATWQVGALAAGARATLDVVMTSTAALRFELSSTRTGSAPVDGNPANDVARVVLDVVSATGGGRFVATANLDDTGARKILTGTGQNEPAQLRVFDGQGQPGPVFYPFDPRFAGGVRVAACDIDGDGRDEVIAAAGQPGGGPHIRIFKIFAGDRIVEVNSWYAFGEAYRGGVYVACGDVNGDGAPEVIAGTGSIGPAGVRIWEVSPFYFREIAAFVPVFAHQAPEARVAACDLNRDGRSEVLVASGPGAPAEVVIGDIAAGVVRGTLRPLLGMTTGALVACGELTTLSPGPEIIVAADTGGAPIVEFYSAAGAPLASVLTNAADYRGGVRVAAGDVDAGVPGDELIVGAGEGAIPLIRVVSGFGGVLVELRGFIAPNVP